MSVRGRRSRRTGATAAVAVALVALAGVHAGAQTGPPARFDHAIVDNAKGNSTYPGAYSQLSEPSTSATFDTPNFGGMYSWTIPKDIPASGADIVLETTAIDKSGARIETSITAGASFGTFKEGDADVPGAPAAYAFADKNGGKPSVTTTKTFHFVPRELDRGQEGTIRVDLGPNGPGITYVYMRAELARPVTPPTVRPKPGKTTSYAAPTSVTKPVSIATPKLSSDTRKLILKSDFTRAGGEELDPESILVGLSGDNIAKGFKLCEVTALTNAFTKELNEDAVRLEFARCVLVVARILQRHQELHPKARAAAAGCATRVAKLKGGHTPSGLRVSCSRTSAGIRLVIRSTSGSLRKKIGTSARLIVGRVRSDSQPIQAGDRVNVRWTLSR